MKIFYTPSLLLESFKPFVGVFLKKFRKFSHKMVSRFFNHPQFMLENSAYTSVFGAIFLSYNCYYEKYSDGTIKNIQDEIPFELPAGWAWSKISAISFVTKLAGFEYTNYIADNLCNDGIPLFKGKNVQDGKIIYEFESYIPLNISNALPRSQISRKCLLTPYVGTIGNIGIHNKQGIYHLGSNVGKIELYNQTEVLLEEYVVAYMKSTYGYKELTKHIKATAQASISIDAIRDVYIAIPPSNEQIKISNKIDEIFSFISVVENSRKEIEDIKTLLKSKILELAMQGKLVPQDENDEPATVLLERIRAERKVKLGKKYVESYIYKGDDNCYYEKIGKNSVDITESFAFEVPPKWEICRLESIVEMYTGNSINESDKAKKYIGLSDGYNYIATKDISFNHTVNYDNGVKIPYGEPKFKIAYKGDPLLCIEGGSAGRKIAILSEDVCFVNKLCVFHSLGVNKKYLYYYLQSPQFCELFKKNTSGLIGGVSINTLKSLYFMLPPLSEQLRIVCAVEKVFSYIDEIEKSLN